MENSVPIETKCSGYYNSGLTSAEHGDFSDTVYVVNS